MAASEKRPPWWPTEEDKRRADAAALATAERKAKADRGRLAELLILEHYNAHRTAAGHDYGGGQRRWELRRLRAELGQPGPVHAVDFTAEELAAAWKRVAAPKVRRIEREPYRHRTPATQRSMRAWERTARVLGIQTGSEEG